MALPPFRVHGTGAGPELQRRLERDHSPVRAFAAHPGFVATNLSTHSESNLTTQLLWDVSEQLTAVGYPALVG